MPPAPSSAPPELLQSGLSRRRLLKLAGVGGLLLAVGGGLFRTLRGFGPPAQGLGLFDAYESPVVDALCEARFPGPPEGPFSSTEVQLPRFVDLYVSGFYEDTQGLFRTLVRALDASTLPTHGRRFRNLTVPERREVLQAWADSSLKVRRAGYQSLAFVTSLGYFEDDRVRAALGFTWGCDLSATPGRPTLWTDSARPGGA